MNGIVTPTRLRHDPPGTAPPLTGPRSRRWRFVLLAGGGFALLIGVWTGLARAGVHEPFGPVASHGVVMVFGFLGTLIALERAVALGRRWTYAGPALSAGAVGGLTFGLPAVAAGVMLTGAGLVVSGVYATLLRRRFEPYLAIMAAGAVAWVTAAALWTAGLGPVRISPLLAAFLVLTIVGERVELSRLRFPSPGSQRRLLSAVAVFAAGAAWSIVDQPTGLVVAGVGLVAQAGWLLRNDLARVTVHRAGLPRFAAVCLLAGYGWLAAAGVLWIVQGAGLGGWLIHDAALHALFLGFVMSMVMGHAPIIGPAVLGITLPHRPAAWVPLVLLHASVAARVSADLAGAAWLRGWAAHGNATALLLFVATAATIARRASRATSTAHRAALPHTKGPTVPTETHLDVRALAPAQRHERILGTYHELPEGEAFVLVNDHDPKPLYYQFAAEYPDRFTWTYLQTGPEVWTVKIGRPPTPPPEAA